MGIIQIKLKFVPTTNSQNLMKFDEIFSELIKCLWPLLVSVPLVCYIICVPNFRLWWSPFQFPISISLSLMLNLIGHSSNNHLCGFQIESVGTIHSNPCVYFKDDGGLSSDNSNSDEDTDFINALDTMSSPSSSPKPLPDIYIPPSPSSTSATSSITTGPRLTLATDCQKSR